MFVAKSFVALLLLFHVSYLASAEYVFSKPGHRYTYEYHVDVQVNPELEVVKKIGYKVYFDVYPKSDREYVVDVTDAKPYYGEETVSNAQLQELKSPFLVRRLKSRNVNKYSDYKLTFTHSKESLWSQNLKKALVTLLEVDYRRTEVQYEVSQEGLSGTCDYKYVVDRRPHKDLHGAFYSYVTRVKNDDVPCYREKTHSYFLSDKVAQCHQKTDLHSKRDYFYTLDELSDDHLVVRHVEANEKLYLTYGVNHHVSYPIVSKQVLHLVNDESFSYEQSSNQLVKDFFAEKTRGDYLQTTLEGHYQPYFGHDTIDDKYLVKRVEELAPKLVSGLVHEKKFLHYEDIFYLFVKSNYNELKRRYELTYSNVDQLTKAKIFFSLLQNVPHFDGVKFVLDYSKEYIEGSPTAVLKEPYVLLLFNYLHSAKFPLHGFTSENADYFYNYCKHEFVKNDHKLHKVCYLAFSRVVNAHCTKNNPSCSLEKAEYYQEQTLNVLNLKYEDRVHLHKQHNENLLLAIKVIKNFRLLSGLPILRVLTLDPEIHHGVRKEAAWSFYVYEKLDQSTQSTLLNIANNRKEDYSIRLAVIFALIPHNPHSLIGTVDRLANNYLKHTYEDNQQLVHGVFDMLYWVSRQNVTTCNKHLVEGSRVLYEYFGDEYLKRFPLHHKYPLLTESAEYNQNSNLDRRVIYAVFSSNKHLLPESVFFQYGDAFNEQTLLFGYDLTALKLYHGDYNAPELSRVLQDFYKSLNIKNPLDSKVKSVYVSFSLNQYENYFIYSDERSHTLLSEFVYLFGSPLKNLFYVDYGSYTESGFPYYFHARQSRYVKLNYDKVEHSLELPFVTYGYVASTVYLPLTDHYLLKGRTFNKYLQHKLDLKLHKTTFEKDAYELDGEVVFKKLDYYETVQKYHYIESYKSLPHYFFVDGPAYEYVPEKYGTYVDREVENFVYETKYPYDQYEPVDSYLNDLHLVFLPIDTLLHKLKPYEKHFYLENVPKTLVFKLYGKYVDNGYYEHYLGLSSKTGLLYELGLKYKHDLEAKVTNYLLKFKDHLLKHNALLKVDVLFPTLQYHYLHYGLPQAVHHLKNATVALKVYFTDDVNRDLKPGEDVLYAQATGLLYKKLSPEHLYDLQLRLDHSLHVDSYHLKHDLEVELYQYDSLDLDVKHLKQYPEYYKLQVKYLLEYYNYFYSKYGHYYYNTKTELNNYKLHLSSYPLYNGYRLNTAHFTTPQGQLQYYGYPLITNNYYVNLVPLLFPNAYYLYHYHHDHYYHNLVNHGYCYLKHDHIETFDGFKHYKPELKYDKPYIVVADHVGKHFVVTLNEKNVYSVYYYLGVNVTYNANTNTLLVDGKVTPVEFGSEPKVYKYKHFYLSYLLYQNKPVVDLYFENGLLLTVHPTGELHVSVTPAYIGSLVGLCGNYDRDWSNELYNKLGEEVSQKYYVQGWQY